MIAVIQSYELKQESFLIDLEFLRLLLHFRIFHAVEFDRGCKSASQPLYGWLT